MSEYKKSLSEYTYLEVDLRRERDVQELAYRMSEDIKSDKTFFEGQLNEWSKEQKRAYVFGRLQKLFLPHVKQESQDDTDKNKPQKIIPPTQVEIFDQNNYGELCEKISESLESMTIGEIMKFLKDIAKTIVAILRGKVQPVTFAQVEAELVEKVIRNELDWRKGDKEEPKIPRNPRYPSLES